MRVVAGNAFYDRLLVRRKRSSHAHFIIGWSQAVVVDEGCTLGISGTEHRHLLPGSSSFYCGTVCGGKRVRNEDGDAVAGVAVWRRWRRIAAHRCPPYRKLTFRVLMP